MSKVFQEIFAMNIASSEFFYFFDVFFCSVTLVNVEAKVWISVF